MECHVTNEFIYAVACVVLMSAGLFSSIIRWNHMCRPFNEDREYFYPGRKQVSFFTAAVLLQFPYALNPSDPGCWMFIRVFGILFYPLCFSMLFRRFFRNRRLEDSKAGILIFASTFSIIIAMLLMVLTGHGELLCASGGVFSYIMALFSMFLTIGYIKEVSRIKKLFKSINEGTYSNEEDFPYVFARKVYLLPVIWMVFMWVVFLTGSRWTKVAADVICTGMMINFICTILHPQEPFLTAERKEHFHNTWLQITTLVKELISNDEFAVMENDSGPVSIDEQKYVVPDEVRREVMAVILRNFKDSHLQKSDVMNYISVGNKKAANMFIISVGYYNLVNAVRLRYSRHYLDLHPRATRDEVAEESGFTSRFRLSRVEKKGITFDERLLDDIRFDDK